MQTILQILDEIIYILGKSILPYRTKGGYSWTQAVYLGTSIHQMIKKGQGTSWHYASAMRDSLLFSAITTTLHFYTKPNFKSN